MAAAPVFRRGQLIQDHTGVCEREQLVCRPWPCNTAAETAIQPLIWQSKSMCSMYFLQRMAAGGANRGNGIFVLWMTISGVFFVCMCWFPLSTNIETSNMKWSDARLAGTKSALKRPALIRRAPMGRYTRTLNITTHVILPRIPTRRCMCSSAHVWFHLTCVTCRNGER